MKLVVYIHSIIKRFIAPEIFFRGFLMSVNLNLRQDETVKNPIKLIG